MSLKKAILCLIVCGALTAAGGYLYVDHMVEARLESHPESITPAVYSDLLRVSASNRIAPSKLKEAMARRHYRGVSANPEKPGEFVITPSRIDLVTKPFTDARGVHRSAQKISYNFEDGVVINHSTPGEQYFELEPEVIETLKSGEQKAVKFVPLEQIPKNLVKAVIAIEDERFYSHAGVDLIGILRALTVNLKAMKIVQGGSTLTQQLAKNLFFSPKKTLLRKGLEALAAISLERRLGKEKILEMYLNEVYLGQEGNTAIHGAAEAAAAFFGKDLKDISLSEAALTAGVIKAPSYYSPKRHKKRAFERKNTVLKRMFELKKINRHEYQKALKASPRILSTKHYKKTAPFFINALKKELNRYLDLDSEIVPRLRIYTGLDIDLQKCAESALKTGIKKLEQTRFKNHPHRSKLEGGLVAIEPFSGIVKAWAGGKDYSQNQFDHVIQAKRQIGSTVKPFLYLTALDSTLNDYRTATPITLISDRPMNVDLVTHDVWQPENYDRKFRGDVTFRYALENSLNVPAAYIGQKVGIDNLAATLRRFRVADSPQAVPALALGAADTNLLRLTSAYAALANGGNYVKPRLFLSVFDMYNDLILKNPFVEENVANEDAVYVLTNIMQGVVERGTGRVVRSLGYTYPAAGKTGTSSDTRDAWFVGFDPGLAVGVWVGFDDDSKTGLTGASGAAPIWTGFMKCAEPYRSNPDFIAPPGVVFVNIDAATGEVATPACPKGNIVREVFVRGTEPRRRCHVHGDYYDRDPDFTERKPSPEYPSKRRRRKSLWDVFFGD